MKKWIYATDACEILKSNSSLVYRAAKEHGWEYKMGPSSKTGGPRRKMFLSVDVRWLKGELKKMVHVAHNKTTLISDGDAVQIYIRASSGENKEQIADDYGISYDLVYNIKRGSSFASATLEYRNVKPKGRVCGIDTLSEVMGLAEWADSLTEWPDLKEIEKRTTFKYRVPDIVSVIENRVARGFAELKMV